jgi:hypothetical protein
VFCLAVGGKPKSFLCSLVRLLLRHSIIHSVSVQS